MFVHRRAERGIDFAVQVIRDLVPHLFAVHGFPVHHGLLPFSNGKRLNQPCSHPAASRSRNINRARSKRVFTEPVDMPRASAVSCMLLFSTSRSTIASRYLRSRVRIAWASF